jgi:hypothetical protein
MRTIDEVIEASSEEVEGKLYPRQQIDYLRKILGKPDPVTMATVERILSHPDSKAREISPSLIMEWCHIIREKGDLGGYSQEVKLIVHLASSAGFTLGEIATVTSEIGATEQSHFMARQSLAGLSLLREIVRAQLSKKGNVEDN